MLAAIILEVMEKAESDALKVMIYMIEGILPENYFSSNLRGLSVDMAVFRDLMKLRLPKLSKHLDDLQNDANDGVSRKFLTAIELRYRGPSSDFVGYVSQIVADLAYRWRC